MAHEKLVGEAFWGLTIFCGEQNIYILSRLDLVGERNFLAGLLSIKRCLGLCGWRHQIQLRVLFCLSMQKSG